MKKKRKERWDGLEFLVRGWIQFNKDMYLCLPDSFKALYPACRYCDCEMHQ